MLLRRRKPLLSIQRDLLPLKATMQPVNRIQEEKNKELEEQFRRKLGSILTANQTKALNGAADEEQQRAASEGIRKKEAPVK